MFNENLKTIRKNRGFSQEQLSVRLNVVRQTISKWEKGLSVPDAQMLVKISEVLDVPISDLLGKEVMMEENSDSLQAVALELEKLNELLTVQQGQRTDAKKKITAVVVIVVAVLLLMAIYDQWNGMFYEFGQHIYHWFH